MARYRRYRSWRYRSSYTPATKFTALQSLLGGAVSEIQTAFLALEADAIDNLFSDYGAIHGDSAERYARKAYPKWRSGATKLSGKTMERLVVLVPPYLEPEQRHTILLKILDKHKRQPEHLSIRIDIKNSEEGFRELDQAMAKLESTDPLAYLPEKVMEAAKWLYDDDITAARAMLAEAVKHETDLIRANAIREIALLKKTISSGQVKSANYSVTTPTSRLAVTAYSKSKCFVATVCYGEDAIETQVLRQWRDDYLMQHRFGRDFVVWYYTHGEAMANTLERLPVLKTACKKVVGLFVKTCIETRGLP
ncbi:CFI-box-CTERM domain-containing protein [Halopseudomonas laoshanensis]|uniref:CFI-box-CTERM domain-containing protein n=1 Tax=Halopseudomonas laoshanensis TaxID=2268758 RepID=UPI003735D2F7